MEQENVKGSILLAEEGLNATIAGPEQGVRTVLSHITQDPRFANLFVKYSQEASPPFGRAKVRLKKEIITMGLPANTAQRTGEHVTPEVWNRLLDDPEVLVLDTRNSYETHLGTFDKAEVWPLEEFSALCLDAGRRLRLCLPARWRHRALSQHHPGGTKPLDRRMLRV